MKIRFNLSFVLVLMTLSLSMLACNPKTGSFDSVDSPSELGNGGGDDNAEAPTPENPTPQNPNPSEPTPPATSPYVVEYAPLWEATRLNDGRDWTLYSFDIVKKLGTNLLAGTNDMATFCPNYSALSSNRKLNFWVYLISAMTKYESGFNPLSRFHESSMGTDPVTDQPVYSEGLLQLSYQDSLWYSFCNEFNWEVDQHLSPTDPKKTILSPYKNLKCGIQILNRLVGSKKLISFGSGHYWAVLKPTSTAQPKIVAHANSIPFCKK